MGHSGMSRNWCVKAQLPGKPLRRVVNHLALGRPSIPTTIQHWEDTGPWESVQSRQPLYLVKKSNFPTCHMKPLGNDQVSFGSQGGSLVLLAIIGLGAPSPICDYTQSCFQGPLVCISGRVLVDFSYRGGICPSSGPPGCI